MDEFRRKYLADILIQGYDSVDNAVVWSIVRKHLPLLRVEVERLLDRP